MTLKPKRILAWKVLGIVVGLLVFCSAALCYWVDCTIDARWSEMEHVVQGLHEEALARPTTRAVLYGDSEPGDAWNDYAKALTIVSALADPKGSTSFVLQLFAQRDPDGDRTKVEPLIALSGSALEELRRGAHRSHSRYPVDWSLARHNPSPSWVSDYFLASLALCRARLLEEEGRWREAIELVLDISQFARDHGDNATAQSEAVFRGISREASDELRLLINSGALQREDLQVISRGLAVLSEGFPSHGQVMMNEVLMVGLSLLSEAKVPKEEWGGRIGSYDPGWRYFFSQRLLKTDGFGTILTATRQTAQRDMMPPGEAGKIRDDLMEAAAGTKNPFASDTLSRLAYDGSGLKIATGVLGRGERARLQLLRVAASWRATGEILEMDDPFGGKLMAAVTGHHLKVWSVGASGRDEGGSGNWGALDGPNIVLEVER
jgi:hypothetical protein